MNPWQRLSTTLVLSAALAAMNARATDNGALKFDFGGKPLAGWTPISPANLYSPATGYGFEPGATLVPGKPPGTSLTSANPYYFSVKVPEGNYKITVLLGTGSVTTIKAELRRLMAEDARATNGGTHVRTFLVNVRTPDISPGNRVRLKEREMTSEIWDWDDKLTLEFNGPNPCVSKLTIEKADVPTVFLLGDSTVCDQPAEPWNSWGQMLPRFFKPEIAVANHAESGETLANALRAQRFEKIFSLMRKGDYLFIQFGHNDQKDKSVNALETYRANLKKVVGRTRSLGGTPVLVTSMERKGGVERDTLAGYPDTMRAVAREEQCALIDLHAMSRILYRSLGADLGRAFQDGTHHTNYGSYELAKCVVEGIKRAKLPLAKSIADDFGGFDPAKPDAVATFGIPASPVLSTAKPLGN